MIFLLFIFISAAYIIKFSIFIWVLICHVGLHFASLIWIHLIWMTSPPLLLRISKGYCVQILPSDSIYVKKKSCELFTKQAKCMYRNEGFTSKIQNNDILLVGAGAFSSDIYPFLCPKKMPK